MSPSKILFDKDIIKKSKYSKIQDFHSLMRFRVRNILLVSSLYDSYIFEEEGRLYELVRKEYQDLNLSQSPELVQVSSGIHALELAQDEKRFDLIITTQHVEDMSAITFAKHVKESGLNIPVVLLGYDNRNLVELLAHEEIDIFDKIFIWQGDYKIVIGIVKYIEDKYNLEEDTKNVGVQSIILIEDNIRFYSSYLPLLYTELYKQSQMLLSEGISLSHKFLRMRARPKILLSSNYEEAMNYYEKYEEYILGIITDIDFTRGGKRDGKAGLIFSEQVKKRYPDIPILIQSAVPEYENIAASMGASFVLKGSPTLLQDVSTFMKNNFGFGDFIFRDENNIDYGHAKNLTEFEWNLENVPTESILFHASKNHFSNWLKARTEFWLAHQLRPKKVSDFSNPEDLRDYIVNKVRDFRKSRQIGVISDFNIERFDPKITFARIGGGSIGGKARGLGFVNNLLSNFEVRNLFPGVEIFVPAAVIIGVESFDQFLDDNNLREFALTSKDDNELRKRFYKADIFPQNFLNDLRSYLSIVREPIAVRSSSLLEDSQGQPFAGVYDTIMLPNNEDDVEKSLKNLLTAIKQIYVSVFFQKSKDYIKVTSYRLEEEKMAIIIQRMVGTEHNKKFYPEISGVAKSFNFYPTPPLKQDDGIVSAALGLGKMIVEGGMAVRFCPIYPQNISQFSTIIDTLNYSPKEFYAISMTNSSVPKIINDDTFVAKYSLDEAFNDGTLNSVGSTYSHENDAIYDGVSRSGMHLFTLSPVLKYRLFPLPEIIELLLEMGSWGMGAPVEIEFAVNLSVPKGEPVEFAVLQMRPLVISNEREELDIDMHTREDLICRSENTLGNGLISDIHDIVFVDPLKFDRKNTREIAHEIMQLNSKLIHEDKTYILIGLGRWGTLDPWLGIPVTWEMISGARTIIESNFKDLNVSPSQGSHFFQNLTSFKVGYFTVNDFEEKGFIDWEWLNKKKPDDEKKFTKHISFKNPIVIKINGLKNKGIIIKSE